MKNMSYHTVCNSNKLNAGQFKLGWFSQELQFLDAQKQNEIYVYITDCQYSQKKFNAKIILEIDKRKKEKKESECETDCEIRLI